VSLDAICESFNIPPDVALRQDPSIVVPILEARLARQAQHQHSADPTRLTEGQTRIWLEMVKELEIRQEE